MEKLVTLVGTVVLAALVVVVAILGTSVLLAYPLKWAWNYVMPSVFNLPSIGALEAFCLTWVAGTLIKPSTTSTKS